MRCTKSHNNFPNFPSTTYTAFVPNYSYPLGAATAAAVSAQGVAGESQGPPLQPAPTPLASGEAARAKAAEAAASVVVAAGGGTPGRAPVPPYCSPSVLQSLRTPVPPYCSLSAPPLGQTEPPPAYEDVLKMDEESQEASTEVRDCKHHLRACPYEHHLLTCSYERHLLTCLFERHLLTCPYKHQLLTCPYEHHFLTSPYKHHLPVLMNTTYLSL